MSSISFAPFLNQILKGGFETPHVVWECREELGEVGMHFRLLAFISWKFGDMFFGVLEELFDLAA